MSTFNRSFSVVIGNPPWGYDFSKEETSDLVKNYYTAKPRGIESYDLFIEKGLEMLQNNGYLAYVLPEAVLNVTSHIKAREIILQYASFKFVSYLGNAFPGVQCPAVIMGLQKDGQRGTRNCRVSFDHTEFTIGINREVNPDALSFHVNDAEYDCLCAIDAVKNAEYLAKNAEFALGIVTGNNKEYIRNKQEEGFEVILKGSDIFRYAMRKSENYIRFTPETFQQVAPIKLYRAKEKLLYRFIAGVPVFTYDNAQTLSLNSCNILIPQIDGMHIKYVLAILNSSVAAFFMHKKFNSIKLLRAHIEALPIPRVSAEKQNEIIEKVDYIMGSKENIKSLYEELDKDIMEAYGLSYEQQKIIISALNHLDRFLW